MTLFDLDSSTLGFGRSQELELYLNVWLICLGAGELDVFLNLDGTGVELLFLSVKD